MIGSDCWSPRKHHKCQRVYNGKLDAWSKRQIVHVSDNLLKVALASRGLSRVGAKGTTGVAGWVTVAAESQEIKIG